MSFRTSRVYVTSLPPETLLACIEDYVCMGGMFLVIKRLQSDLPLAGHSWKDGFAVRINRPSEFSIVAKVSWDGEQSTIVVSMWHHVWIVPVFAVSIGIFLFWAIAYNGPGMLEAILAIILWFVVLTGFSIFQWYRGHVVMNMLADVLKRVTEETHAKLYLVPKKKGD